MHPQRPTAGTLATAALPAGCARERAGTSWLQRVLSRCSQRVWCPGCRGALLSCPSHLCSDPISPLLCRHPWPPLPSFRWSVLEATPPCAGLGLPRPVKVGFLLPPKDHLQIWLLFSGFRITLLFRFYAPSPSSPGCPDLPVQAVRPECRWPTVRLSGV